MEKIYEHICAVFTAGYGNGRKAEELAGIYRSLGTASTALDNMFYDRMGLCCEDLIDMLVRGEDVIS
jgi:hypothetical protein